jgi:hypothetical protein
MTSVFFSQKASVKGKITDQKSESVYNALVTVSQSTVKAKSDPDGNYELVGIPISSSKTTVEITIKATGYNDLTFTVELEPNQVLEKNIELTDGVKSFEEAIVIGYGTTRTRNSNYVCPKSIDRGLWNAR